MKVRLFCDVEYDETMASPETIAAELDAVIGVALGHLGALDEFGDVTVSDMGVVNPIVVATEGGLITAIGARGGLPVPVVTIDYDADDGYYGDDDTADSVPQDDGSVAKARVGVSDIDGGDPIFASIADFADETVVGARSAAGTVA